MPEMHVVTISNPSAKNQIRILSIRTGSPHFHASPVKIDVSSAVLNISVIVFFLYFLVSSGAQKCFLFFRT